MGIKKNPLTPRQTAIRLLEHMDTDATYADIIHQMRILQDIDQTMNDVDLAGFEGNEVVEEARTATAGSWDPIADGSDDAMDSLLQRAVWRH